ncbi:MAG: TRAP transporter small permease [Elusimicrobiota bacterium]|jgi:TRAP-type C4-dicarboxylate transport system permease small subunit|nr:TRAP transporter small permease [Elusimicrobiota bacterium]
MIKKLLNIDIVISSIFMIVLIIVTSIGVIFRYCFNSPIIWGEEIQVLCIVIVVFFGGAAGFRHSSHIAIDFIVDKFPKRLERIADIAIVIISSLILIYFAAQGAMLANQMYETERSTDILQIPYFIPYLAFPLGFLLMAVNLIITEYKRLFGGIK